MPALTIGATHATRVMIGVVPAIENNPTESNQDELTRWRRTLFLPLARVCSVLGVVGTGAMLVTQSTREHFHAAQLALFIGLTIALIALTLLPYRSLRVRSAAVIAVCGAYCLNFIAHTAFELPGPYMALVLLLTMVALVAGARTAWMTLALCVAGFALVGALHVSGALPPVVGLLDSSDAINWLTIPAIFVTCSAGAIHSVSFLLRRLEAELTATRELSGATIETIKKQFELEQKVVQGQKVDALGKLAGGMAHDFNNLLTVIVTSLKLAQTEDDAAVRRELLTDAQDASGRATELTRDLLAFSQQHVVQHEATELAVAIKKIARLVKRLMPENIALDIDERDQGLWVDVAQIELDQIMLNLSINARDAMPRGGGLSFRINKRGDMACIDVRDTGEGMTPQTAAKIFEPFFTTKKGEGTGLGLAVVHGVVTKRGGTITVHSAPGEGTEFHVCLPLAAPPQQAAGEREDGAATPTIRATILVVEDEPSVRRVVQRVLEGVGYEILVNENGEQALETLKSRSDVRLVVTDVIMPGMDGRALYDIVAAQYPHIPVLFCSGYTSALLTEEVLSLPGRDFISKPFTPDALLDKVRALLG